MPPLKNSALLVPRKAKKTGAAQRPSSARGRIFGAQRKGICWFGWPKQQGAALRPRVIAAPLRRADLGPSGQASARLRSFRCRGEAQRRRAWFILERPACLMPCARGARRILAFGNSGCRRRADGAPRSPRLKKATRAATSFLNSACELRGAPSLRTVCVNFYLKTIQNGTAAAPAAGLCLFAPLKPRKKESPLLEKETNFRASLPPTFIAAEKFENLVFRFCSFAIPNEKNKNPSQRCSWHALLVPSELQGFWKLLLFGSPLLQPPMKNANLSERGSWHTRAGAIETCPRVG